MKRSYLKYTLLSDWIVAKTDMILKKELSSSSVSSGLGLNQGYRDRKWGKRVLSHSEMDHIVPCD